MSKKNSTLLKYEKSKPRKKILKYPPPNVHINDYGYEIFSTGYGPITHHNFQIVEITNNGRKIRVKVLKEYRIESEWYDWRTPGHWVAKGQTAKEYRCHKIVLGEISTYVDPTEKDPR